VATYGHALCRLAEKIIGPQRRYLVWGIGSNSNPMERGSRLDVHKDFILRMTEGRKKITLNGIVAQLAKDRSVQIVRSALSIWLLARCFRF